MRAWLRNASASVLVALPIVAGAPAHAADAALSLLSGREWPTRNITYGFPAPGFAWGSTYGSRFPGGFEPLTDGEKVAARRALRRWAAASGGVLRFVEVAAERAQIRFALTTVPMGAVSGGTTQQLGYTYYPGSGRGGDVWLSTGIRRYGFADGSYGFAVLTHEVGHGLGLKHPNEGSPVLDPGLDYPANTVMSRRAYRGDPSTDGWGPGLPSYPSAPGPLDRRAMALAY